MGTTYALIYNGVVVELIAPAYDSVSGAEIPITSRFTQDFVQSLVPVTGTVAVGYTYVSGVFTPPAGVSTVTALQAAKALQITVLSEACQASIFLRVYEYGIGWSVFLSRQGNRSVQSALLGGLGAACG
jgi:hypothetical protein